MFFAEHQINDPFKVWDLGGPSMTSSALGTKSAFTIGAPAPNGLVRMKRASVRIPSFDFLNVANAEH